jgi:hypothetical protein
MQSLLVTIIRGIISSARRNAAIPRNGLFNTSGYARHARPPRKTRVALHHAEKIPRSRGAARINRPRWKSARKIRPSVVRDQKFRTAADCVARSCIENATPINYFRPEFLSKARRHVECFRVTIIGKPRVDRRYASR